MISVSSGILVILGLAVCAAAQAEEVFYDYAQVSAVELLKDDAYRRADKTGPLCGQQRAPVTVPSRGSDVAGLAAAIGQAMEKAERSQCIAESRTRITGYRVHYSYGGVQYMRVLDFDPGDRIRVRVTLDARP